MTSSMMTIVILLVATLFQGASAMNVFNGLDDGIFPLFPTFANIPLICDNEVVDAPWWVCSESPPSTGTTDGGTTTDTTEAARETTAAPAAATKKGGDKRTRKLGDKGTRKLPEKKPEAPIKKSNRRKRKLRGE